MLAAGTGLKLFDFVLGFFNGVLLGNRTLNFSLRYNVSFTKKSHKHASMYFSCIFHKTVFSCI